ncbi:hypothetical protein MJO28_003250 [Puccinia striiformis f. sp. tritici]|uniref:Uncharacterized protein n=1 Tax=Puccinia striiformis f. sp. tritici TaxID=168172 RepID=A0ACC0ESS7_9BASI|nr:hypothetical protein MJO28_003250 [Puccinia striiformis f. sp. tritici]
MWSEEVLLWVSIKKDHQSSERRGSPSESSSSSLTISPLNIVSFMPVDGIPLLVSFERDCEKLIISISSTSSNSSSSFCSNPTVPLPRDTMLVISASSTSLSSHSDQGTCSPSSLSSYSDHGM